jgi:serine/threonine protein kinase
MYSEETNFIFPVERANKALTCNGVKEMVSYLPRYCTNCGAANQPHAAFCFACGHSLQAQVDTPPLISATTGSLVPAHLLKERYRIGAQIGKGVMGTVYKAEDTLFDDHFVAIKELSQSGLNKHELVEATTAFKREAHLLVGLNHPNLPKIQDYFTDAGRWYLVMDFLEGETLETYLTQRTGGSLPVREVLDIGIQLCSVLDYLHTRQPPIIFRDLKPANVMRTPAGRLYLIDFGIARLFQPGQAKDTNTLGSVGYAAPEEYGKAQTTPRSDIFSLGAVLYQLLTGTDPSQALFQFAPLHLHALPFPAELETLLMQMLEMVANKRPASMAVVKQELQRIAARVPATQGSSRPVTLPQATFIHRLSRPSKAKFIALMGLTLLVVSGIGLFSLVQANQVVTKHANAVTTANANATATTAAVDASSTATVNALTPTVNATAEVIELQNMYNNTTHGTPALDDPLRDNSKGNSWKVGTSADGAGTCAFTGGAYHVSQLIYVVHYCTARPSFSNFIFEVQMKIIKGDAGGVIFRANTLGNYFYVFAVNQYGVYQVFLRAGYDGVLTMAGGASLAIKRGLNQTNLISVIAQGRTIGLYVNHQLIDSVNDNTYSSGQIGVIAYPYGNSGNPTEVVYSNVKVWTI